MLRHASSRTEEPSAVVLDPRTLRHTPQSGADAVRDGHERTRGTKLHAAVDTFGQMLALAHRSLRIVEGRLRRSIRHLAELPQSWAEREHALGF